ncbi:hypothetical protein [Streptomyces shenzhenensis]|uniref:Uncharacterized protein n=1 Tax=Streptomyces shenzhenensis TaxID=943815 RepID=A0A3M0ICJ0_9ACTN|nr:hypothetical protein [Streptomyces shenzhenensis]RMB86574.1 hypothetical protein CTZ28_05725 [Streptomyces shenzhenensis]
MSSDPLAKVLVLLCPITGPTLHEAAYAAEVARGTMVTSVFGIGRHYVERHYARGSEARR